MRGSVSITALVVCAALLAASDARAEDFYVDPETGSMANDGSQGSPWSTIEEVIAAGRIGTAVGAGDNVWLRSGYHGELLLDGGDYASPITIAAESGQTPRVRR